jgi:hypothetical protein
VRRSKPGAELDGLLVRGDHLLPLTLDLQGQAESVEAAGVPWVDLDGLPVGGDGLVQLALG